MQISYVFILLDKPQIEFSHYGKIFVWDISKLARAKRYDSFNLFI